jgi:hypothetical protein
MAVWQKFCQNKINKIEKTWNRKLEDSTADDEGEEEAEKKDEQVEDDDSLPNHDTINDLLERFDRNRLSRSHVETRKNDPTSNDL